MIKIGVGCARGSASAVVYPAALGIDCQLSIMVVFAYLLLGYPFGGFLTESRRHGLGYLQGAVEC